MWGLRNGNASTDRPRANSYSGWTYYIHSTLVTNLRYVKFRISEAPPLENRTVVTLADPVEVQLSGTGQNA